MKFRLLPAVIPFMLFVLLFASCDQDEEGIITPPTGYPQVDSLRIPDKMSLNSAHYHLFQVMISGDSRNLQVKCSLSDTAGAFLGSFTLHDDASAYPVEDDSSFASERSLDVAAGDGIFSRGVNSMFTGFEGLFTADFTVTTSDSDTVGVLDAVIDVYENQPPVLHQPNLPDTLASGFTSRSMDMLVTDPQGREDISGVWFEIYSEGTALGLIYNLEDPDLDSIYSYYLEPSIAAGLETGDYLFRFTAEDSLEAWDSLDAAVYLENEPPEILEVATDPDTEMVVPDSGEIAEVLVTALISDPQTLADIDTAFFNYERPDGTWDTYIMVDNGLPFDIDQYVINPYTPYQGDESAGDGIFSGMKLYTFEVDTGIHRFHIHSIDRVGQEADSVSVELWIHP